MGGGCSTEAATEADELDRRPRDESAGSDTHHHRPRKSELGAAGLGDLSFTDEDLAVISDKKDKSKKKKNKETSLVLFGETVDTETTTVLLADDKDLGEVPAELWRLTRLVQLGLSKNNLTWVSGEIGALTGLHTLDLCCNKLTDLPSEFGLLVNLDTLNLSHNLIRRLPLSIGKLTRLEVLACVGNPLTFPDASVCEAGVPAVLEVLRDHALKVKMLERHERASRSAYDLTRAFSNGALDEDDGTDDVPRDPSQLYTLFEILGHQVPIDVVDLDLRGHTLATLPVDLRRRAQLRTLNLSYNRLSVGALGGAPGDALAVQSFDDSMAGVPKDDLPTSLHDLLCNHNRLVAIPAAVCGLSELVKLALNNNHIADIPPAISRLRNLRHLWLDANKLTEVPIELYRLTKLSSLWLSRNRLTELPPGIAALTSLEEIWLHENLFQLIPSEVSQIPGLVHIRVEGNPLVEEPPALRLEGGHAAGGDETGQSAAILDFLRAVYNFDVSHAVQGFSSQVNAAGGARGGGVGGGGDSSPTLNDMVHRVKSLENGISNVSLASSGVYNTQIKIVRIADMTPDIFGHKGAEVRVVFVPDPNRSSGSVDAAGKAFATPWLSLDGGIEADWTTAAKKKKKKKKGNGTVSSDLRVTLPTTARETLRWRVEVWPKKKRRKARMDPMTVGQVLLHLDPHIHTLDNGSDSSNAAAVAGVERRSTPPAAKLWLDVNDSHGFIARLRLTVTMRRL